MPWVQERYREVGFPESNLNQEYVAIAYMNDTPVGVGRVIGLSETEGELGGMYTSPDARGQGVARKVIEHLLAHNAHYERLYCLPFAKLEGFYGTFGFETRDNDAWVHPQVVAKHAWCGNSFKEQVLLLVRQKEGNLIET